MISSDREIYDAIEAKPGAPSPPISARQSTTKSGLGSGSDSGGNNGPVPPPPGRTF